MWAGRDILYFPSRNFRLLTVRMLSTPDWLAISFMCYAYTRILTELFSYMLVLQLVQQHAHLNILVGCFENFAKTFQFVASVIFFSILLTNEGSHRDVYRDFQPSLTSSAGGAMGWSDHRFRVPPAYTAQLLTLHQHRANNQYRTWLIKYSQLQGLAATLRQHLNSTQSQY